MITIKHKCSNCQNELTFVSGDMSQKFEHLTIKTEKSPAGNDINVYELSGHKFIQCPCCGEVNILGECSETTNKNPFDITMKAEWKNHYGVKAMQRANPDSDIEWNLFSNYDNDVPVADGENVIYL